MADRRTGTHGFVQSPRARVGTNGILRLIAASISAAILVIQLPALLEAFSAPDFKRVCRDRLSALPGSDQTVARGRILL